MSKQLIERLKLNDTTGATAIEYAIIVTVIALIVVGGASLVGNSVNNKFGSISTELKN